MQERPISPEPIRTDSTNTFANNTMKVRIPAIIDETIKLNPDYEDGIVADLRSLQTSVASGDAIPALDIQSAPDYDDWLDALERQQVMVEGDLTWHNVQWFFAETYVYRYMIQAVRWFETNRDPFLPKKRTELDGDSLWSLLDRALQRNGSVDQQMHKVVEFDLWGNRIDLSFSAALSRGTDIADDDLLVDDTPALMDYLHTTARPDETLRGYGDIYIVTDNAGSELTMDLVLTDFLLENVTNKVILHVKMHPTFVSDATPIDIWMTINEMRSHGEKATALADRLTTAWDEGRLKIVPHPFWNSSLFMWDLPMTLRNMMNTARLVIVKGDANYRRVVGDSIWREDTPFSEVLSYMDAPVLCLRTLKSDPIVGLPSLEMAQALDHNDPEWRSNGKHGIIQFKPRTTSS